MLTRFISKTKILFLSLQSIKNILKLSKIILIKKRTLNMAVPKKKTSAAKSKKRRAHKALSISASTKCKKCGELKRPHHICSACGTYRGKKVITK